MQDTHINTLKSQPTTFVSVLPSYIYELALEIPFHKDCLKYLKSIIAATVKSLLILEVEMTLEAHANLKGNTSGDGGQGSRNLRAVSKE